MKFIPLYQIQTFKPFNREIIMTAILQKTKVLLYVVSVAMEKRESKYFLIIGYIGRQNFWKIQNNNFFIIISCNVELYEEILNEPRSLQALKYETSQVFNHVLPPTGVPYVVRWTKLWNGEEVAENDSRAIEQKRLEGLGQTGPQWCSTFFFIFALFKTNWLVQNYFE